ATWTQRNAGMPMTPALFIHSLLVDVNSSSLVYAATDFGVFKSTDGGGSWVSASTGLSAGDVVALAQDGVRVTALFCAVSDAGVFETLDGGATWASVFSQAGLSNLHVRSLAVDGGAGTVYAGSDNGVASVTNYPGSITSAVEPGAEAGSAALRLWPNPLRSEPLNIDLAISRAGRVRAAIY